MSKQYLTVHTVDNAHTHDIFSVAVTPKAVLTASGASVLKVHDTTSKSFPISQAIDGAHPIGCHHICASGDGKVAASIGFGGEVKVWHVNPDTREWTLHLSIEGDAVKDGYMWAIALDDKGHYLAATTKDGKIMIWRVSKQEEQKEEKVPAVVQEYQTGSAGSGSFGTCVALSSDGKWTASGHQNGTVYVFKNETARLAYSLTGLAKAIRTVAFSPGSSRLAAAGDSGVIALYDMQHGEHIANLKGNEAWVTSVDWSASGEYLLSGSMDGKVKVWSVDRKVCVATHSETEKPLWCVKWLPKMGTGEYFCTAGGNRSLTFYREATGI